jgi:hypothetical protein
MSRKPILFISYSHLDEPERPGEGEVCWLSFVVGHLKPAAEQDAIEIWLDERVPGGGDWEREIERKLGACDVFVLLVSNQSMASVYVRTEIAVIRERLANDEDVHFYPLLLTPTTKIALDPVRDRNLRPRDGQPFSKYSLYERHEKMCEAANEIVEIARRKADPRSAPATTSALGTGGPATTFPPMERTRDLPTRKGLFARLSNRLSGRGAEPAAAQINKAASALDLTTRKIAKIADRDSLRAWLRGQNRNAAVAIAARAALRVAPLVALSVDDPSARAMGKSLSLTGAVFRCAALARAAAKYPARASELKFRAAADPVLAYGANADAAADAYTVNADAAAAAFAAADASVADAADAAVAAAADAAAVAAAAYAAPAAADAAAAGAWNEIRADIAALQTVGVAGILDLPLWQRGAPELPLWQRGAPEWASIAWTELQARLPDGSDWEVWIRWYWERLDGGSRGEPYEWVFAAVPLATWDEGPAAANAWIKAHLSKDPDPSSELPLPLPDLDSPFAYAWTAALKVAAVPGGQNLPFYPFFDSEEHHRRTLEACRKGAERLLKALREGSRYNVRPEYAEALRHYLKDLPKAAGEGNILLANDQAVNLREMFAQDRETLPPGFASPLRRVIENQFALNAFYDLVKKHQDAIAASKLTLPFPAEAARRFFGVVEAETPRFFEPPVGEGLRDVERAAPPVALAPDETGPSTAIQPPPLPPGTPDPRQSHERQIATAANALWETFLKGKDLPVAIEAWTEAAQKLGHAVGPLLDFLRGLGS